MVLEQQTVLMNLPPFSEPTNGSGAPPRDLPGRRSFLTGIGIGWAIFSGAALAMLGAMARFLFPNDVLEPEARFKAGRLEDYAPDWVDERWKESRRIWVVREGGELFVLSASCTHLRCALNWSPADQKFRCPCHGSGFYKSGVNFEGPAPRSLERYKVGLAADGQIEIDLSRKFQQELGQWSDPDSHLTSLS